LLRALLTDIDGTLTDQTRRLSTASIETIRALVDGGVIVVLASGNTSCFMESLSRMIGTQGSFIAENGGVYRAGFTGPLHIKGDQGVCKKALEVVQAHYRERGVGITLLSPTYRFADLAFARTVPSDEVKLILKDYPVQVIDTGYAIHLQSPGVNKGTAMVALAADMGIPLSDFVAIGDSVNDIQMLINAGVGLTVANGHPDTKSVAQYVAEKEYGNGFVEAIEKYFPYLRAR